MDLQPYVDKINSILDKHTQPKLTQAETNLILVNWKKILSNPVHQMLAQQPQGKQRHQMMLTRELLGIIYGVLRETRGDLFKW
jgi:hypothetical protein